MSSALKLKSESETKCEGPSSEAGTPFLTSYQKRSGYHAASFSVSIARSQLGGFEVVRETAGDRFFDSIGFSRKCETGDKDFDKRFRIESESPKPMQAFFMESAHREAVTRLFALGFTEVKTLNSSVIALQHRAGPEADVSDAARVREAVGCLAVLRNGQAGFFDGGVDEETRRYHRMRGRLALGGLLCFASGVALCWIANWLYPIVGESFFSWTPARVGLGMAIGLVALSAMWLRGHSSSHRHVGGVAIFFLVGLPLLADGVATFVNGAFDTADPPAQHEALAVSKQKYSHRLSSYYRVRLNSWRPDRQNVSISISSHDYFHTTPQKTVYRVLTKPGTLGYEWLTHLELLSPDRY